MSPETAETFWRALAAVTAMTAAGAPVLVALVSHWRRKPANDATTPAVPAPRSPSVADAATVQGSTLQMEMWAVVRDQLRTETEARLRAEVALDLTEAERDLYRGALERAGLPLPSLIHPSHREDHPHG